jgi:hypothetical protein
MAIRKKKIVVPVGTVPKLARAHRVTETMVYNALSYASNSETAQLIRKEAIENWGGVASHRVIWR